MRSEWILDVLADMRSFAQANRLQTLADHLGEAQMIALAELASLGQGRVAHEKAVNGTVDHDPVAPRHSDRAVQPANDG